MDGNGARDLTVENVRGAWQKRSTKAHVPGECDLLVERRPAPRDPSRCLRGMMQALYASLGLQPAVGQHPGLWQGCRPGEVGGC